MTEHTYTLTGSAAAAAHILEEVYRIFDIESSKDADNFYEEWRLEYYIMNVMCSPMLASYEIRRSKIIEYVKTFFPSYGDPRKNDYNKAFRRLTRRGFLYGTYTTQNWDTPKERAYGLALDRYDKEEAA